MSGSCDSRTRLLQILPEIERIGDPVLRESVISTWLALLQARNCKPDVLAQMPASIKLKDRRFALVHHVRAVTQVVDTVFSTLSSAFPDPPVSLNRDVLLAGALLHDVGKVAEMEKGSAGWELTKQGTLLRHPLIGAAIAMANGVPDSVVQIIAYHSIEGAALPKTAEAEVIHLADKIFFNPFFLDPAS